MGPKRNKSFYKGGSGAKRHKGPELQPGAVGFMFSFAKDRERQAKSEALELLNCYAAEVFGNDPALDTQGQSSDDGSDEDIEAAMQKQIAKLKEKRKPGVMFSCLQTSVNQMMFVKSTLNTHNKITYAILEDARKGELKSNSRVLHRMVPVLASCRAEPDKIGDCVIEAINSYLTLDSSSANRSYKLLVKVRNNSDKELSQHSIIRLVGESVKERFPEWRVDLHDPSICICVDVLIKVCCVSVVHDFLRYKKFNIQELIVSHHTGQAIAKGESRVKNSGLDQNAVDESETDKSATVDLKCDQNTAFGLKTDPCRPIAVDLKTDPSAVVDLKTDLSTAVDLKIDQGAAVDLGTEQSTAVDLKIDRSTAVDLKPIQSTELGLNTDQSTAVDLNHAKNIDEVSDIDKSTVKDSEIVQSTVNT